MTGPNRITATPCEMRGANFRFIDLPTSAERLGITRNELLQWVAEGRIKPFSGSGQQAIFRASEVDRLAAEVRPDTPAVGQTAAVEKPAEAEAVGTPTGAKSRRRDPIKLIGNRISMDSRWAEISDEDIATWLDALEPVQFERVRKVAGIAIERLERVVAMLDKHDARLMKLKGRE
jgi:hypothetical protein